MNLMLTIIYLNVSVIFISLALLMVASAVRRDREIAHEKETGFRHREIWFWQQGRFLRDDWSIQTTGFGWHPLNWPEALFTHLRPTASKFVGTTSAPLSQQEPAQ